MLYGRLHSDAQNLSRYLAEKEDKLISVKEKCKNGGLWEMNKCQVFRNGSSIQTALGLFESWSERHICGDEEATLNSRGQEKKETHSYHRSLSALPQATSPSSDQTLWGDRGLNISADKSVWRRVATGFLWISCYSINLNLT